MLTRQAFPSQYFRRRINRALRHPLTLAVLTFLFTGILATRYQSFLADAARDREILIIKRQRTADAVKSVSDIIFERVFRGNMVWASLRRNAPIDELKDRKKSYDEVFVRYNSGIQSNLFRIREMFDTSDYTDFESMMEGGLRSLLETQDLCLTTAYDDAISADPSRQLQYKIDLMNCKPATNILHPMMELPSSMPMADVLRQLVHCEYVFTDALFRAVERAANNKELAPDTPSQVASACRFDVRSRTPADGRAVGSLDHP